MKGFSYLYSIFFVGFLSMIVVSYFTNVSISYLTQKGILNNEYYNSISREFLSKILNQIIKKINYSQSKIESIEEFGIFDGSVYLLNIQDVNAQVMIKIIKQELKKYKDYNRIEVILRIIVNTKLLNILKPYFADVKLIIISGKIPYYFFQPTGDTIKNIYFFPYHNKSLYNSSTIGFTVDKNKILKVVFGKDDLPNYLDLRESLNLKKVNIPVIDGFYIGEIQGDKYLYFKGEIDKIILGKDETYQFIYAEHGENNFLLKFDNSRNKIIVLHNGTSEQFSGKFTGDILVDGDIDILSSGNIIGSTVLENSEQPALCNNTELNFIIGGKINSISSLKYEGVSIKKGKFRRDKTRLNLTQLDERLFENDKISGDIYIKDEELHGNYFFSNNVYFDSQTDLFGSINLKDYLYKLITIVEDPLNYNSIYSQKLPNSNLDFSIIKNLVLLKIGEGDYE